MKAISLAGLAGILLLPQATRADVICAPSDPVGFYACASITLSWADNAIIMDVRNLDSWDATLSQVVGGYRLAGVGFSGDGSIAPLLTGSMAVETVGSNGGANADPNAYWSSATSFAGNIDVQAGANATTVGWIEGCVATGGGNKDRYITCDPVYSGVVRFTFGTAGLTQEQFSQTAWTYGLRGIAGPDGVSFKCDGADCAVTVTPEGDPEPPSEVVPEPLTLVLLGTGLLGVAGAARRRGRREDVV